MTPSRGGLSTFLKDALGKILSLPPQILLPILLSRLSRSAGHARDAEVLMRSTVSTCPRVGARCYPHFLGITRRSCLEAHRS
jgi:hypothetical protein